MGFCAFIEFNRSKTMFKADPDKTLNGPTPCLFLSVQEYGVGVPLLSNQVSQFGVCICVFTIVILQRL